MSDSPEAVEGSGSEFCQYEGLGRHLLSSDWVGYVSSTDPKTVRGPVCMDCYLHISDNHGGVSLIPKEVWMKTTTHQRALDEAYEALREIVMLCGNPDPSDGEGTSPQEVVEMVKAIRPRDPQVEQAKLVNLNIRLEREDSMPAWGGFLRCECPDHDHNHVILLNVQALMAPEVEFEDGSPCPMSREDRKRTLVTTLMHEFGHALEAHMKLPDSEEAIEKACEEWEAQYAKAQQPEQGQ